MLPPSCCENTTLVHPFQSFENDFHFSPMHKVKVLYGEPHGVRSRPWLEGSMVGIWQFVCSTVDSGPQTAFISALFTEQSCIWSLSALGQTVSPLCLHQENAFLPRSFTRPGLCLGRLTQKLSWLPYLPCINQKYVLLARKTFEETSLSLHPKSLL